MTVAGRIVQEYQRQYGPNPGDTTTLRYFANLAIIMANTLEANGIVDENSVRLLTDKAIEAEQRLRDND